jgi:N6-L-threonylcarbamoyladenine synthase
LFFNNDYNIFMAKPITILAIETSCDETAAAVLVNDKIKSNIIASQAKLHSQFGGVVPEVSARKHVPAIIPTINLAFKKAKVKLTDIDYIAVTQGPGLATSLMTGINTAQALSLPLNKPLIPINHLEAHIYANFIRKNSKFKIQNSKFFPALILIVSGGHTMLVLMTKPGKLKVVGETVDDAAGEAFDKTARMLGFTYPGGPAISKLAKKGNPQAFDFPRPMIHKKNLDFSFSGLKTAVLYKLKDLSPITYNLKSDLAACIEQAIVDVLIAKTKKAILEYEPKSIMLGGGVAANEKLRDSFKLLAKSYKLKCSIPNLEFCTDNAGMIGLAAYYRIKNKRMKSTKNFSAKPNLVLK